MRASGNGNKYRCVENLLAIVRGEVPYDRLRGMNPRLIDRPAPEVEGDIVRDATWLVETYEPRAALSSVTVENSGAQDGRFAIRADIE